MQLIAASAMAMAASSGIAVATSSARTNASPVHPTIKPHEWPTDWHRYTHAMITSSSVDIASHNAAVNTRQVRRHRARMAKKWSGR